jgi:DNA-binding transcriptional MerR regulator
MIARLGDSNFLIQYLTLSYCPARLILSLGNRTEMGTDQERAISLAELAEETGVPARTIRFYIARGLLPGPQQAGRGATYGETHRKQLQEIKRLQAKGLTLHEVARSIGDDTRKASRTQQPSAWWQYPIDEDVVVWVKAEAAPWRLREIQRAVWEMALKLKDTREEEEQE